MIYISCLFLAFYSLFVFHAISTQLDRYINVYRNCEYVVHFSNQIYLNKIKKYIYKIKAGCDTSIVFIHQLLCIENTKEQLPDMNCCHPLQENISSLRGATAPRPPAYRFFISGYATDPQLQVHVVQRKTELRGIINQLVILMTKRTITLIYP